MSDCGAADFLRSDAVVFTVAWKSCPAFSFFPKGIGAASIATGLKSKRRGLLCRFPEDRDSQRGTEEKAGSSGVSRVFDNQRLLELPILPGSATFLYSHTVFLKKLFYSPRWSFTTISTLKQRLRSLRVEYALYFCQIWSLIESLFLVLDESVELML